MLIPASVVYFSLSKRSDIEIIAISNGNTRIRSVRMYSEEDEIEAGNMYIIDSAELRYALGKAQSAFLVCNASDQLTQSSLLSSLDAAFVATDLSKTKLLNIIVDLFTELSEWDALLKDAIIDKFSLLDVLHIGQKIINSEFWLVNNVYEIVESTSSNRIRGSELRINAVSALLHDERFIGADTHIEAYVYPSPPHNLLCKNIFLNGLYSARIFAVPSTPESGLSEMFLFEHLCKYISMIYLQQIDPTRGISANESFYEVLRAILLKKEELSPSEIREAFESIKWRRDQEHTLVTIEVKDDRRYETTVPYLSRQLEADWRYSHALEVENRLVWIVNTVLSSREEREYGLMDYLANLLQKLGCYAGVSLEFLDFDQLYYSYSQSKLALVYGRNKSPHLHYFLFGDYVLDYVIDNINGALPNEAVWHKGLLRIMEHDRVNNSEFTKTLFAYMRNNFSVTAAMEAVYIHRTTFLRRLERIREIGGIDMNNPDEVLHIALSFKSMDRHGIINASQGVFLPR